MGAVASSHLLSPWRATLAVSETGHELRGKDGARLRRRAEHRRATRGESQDTTAGACRSCFGDSAGRLPGTCGRSQPWQRLVRRRRSARSRRRPYGGAVVKWHGLMAIVWLVLRGDVVAVRGAARAFAGSRRLVMLIFGGWVPQDLCSSHVRCLKSSAPAGAGAQATHRGVVCASRDARAASPAATGCCEPDRVPRRLGL